MCRRGSARPPATSSSVCSSATLPDVSPSTRCLGTPSLLAHCRCHSHPPRLPHLPLRQWRMLGQRRQARPPPPPPLPHPRRLTSTALLRRPPHRRRRLGASPSRLLPRRSPHRLLQVPLRAHKAAPRRPRPCLSPHPPARPPPGDPRMPVVRAFPAAPSALNLTQAHHAWAERLGSFQAALAPARSTDPGYPRVAHFKRRCVHPRSRPHR